MAEANCESRRGASNARFRLLVAALVSAKLAVHLAVLGRFDYHRDELYFVACARRLDLGYVDHPPLIAWVTALFGAPFDYDVRALRVAPAIASGATMALTCALVRAMGGGTKAALVAGTCILAAPVYLRTGSILCIPAFEPALWSAAALAVVELARAAPDRRPRAWLLLGGAVGVGLMTKHSISIWALGLAAGIVLGPLRSELRTRWPWIGAGLALALFLPNLVWQVRNDFATVEFLRALSKSVLADVPRGLFLAGIALYLNPFTIPIWGSGLRSMLKRGAPDRAIGIAFLVTLGVLLVTKAKPYYIAGAFPALFAAGGIAIEQVAASANGWRARIPSLAAAGIAASAVPLAVLSLPIVSVDQLDRAIAPIVGWATPPENLTGELHDQFGFREEAAAVRLVAESLDERERARAVVLTGNYGQAAAIDFFERGDGGPAAIVPVASGHMNYFLWGVPAGRGEVAIAIGVPPDTLGRIYRDVREVARVRGVHQAWPSERALPVFLCRDPIESLAAAWPSLKRYGHGQAVMPRPGPSAE